MASWRRLSLVVLVAVTAASAMAASAALDKSIPVPVEQTECWVCHAIYNPPLRQFEGIVPPASVVVGPTASDFTVRVQNAYSKTEVPMLQATLDISHAPSLAFGESPSPVKGATAKFTIPFTPGALDPLNPAAGTRQAGRFTLPTIQDGATRVHVCITPATTGGSGALLSMDLLLGAATTPTFSYKAASPGGSVCNDADDGRVGSGNVTVVASYLYPDPANPGFVPAAAGLEVGLVYDIDFGGNGATQVYTTNTLVAPQQSKLYTWRLRASGAEPTDNESVRVTVNATVHYVHSNKATVSFANVTQTLDVPVRANPDGAGVLLKPATRIGVSATIANGPTLTRISEAVGYASAFLLIASIWSGGMFGKGSRRSLNTLFASAKRRVAFHNFLSYGLTAAAVVHMSIFLFRFTEDYQITLGLIWGSLAILSMFGLGVTGALQIPMIRRWSYGTWRWSHYGLTVAAIAFTVVHMLLDGANFTEVQEVLRWHDPFLPSSGGGIR